MAPPQYNYILLLDKSSSMLGSYNAVSYTHLDVYKRQTLPNAAIQHRILEAADAMDADNSELLERYLVAAFCAHAGEGEAYAQMCLGMGYDKMCIRDRPCCMLCTARCMPC